VSSPATSPTANSFAAVARTVVVIHSGAEPGRLRGALGRALVAAWAGTRSTILAASNTLVPRSWVQRSPTHGSARVSYTSHRRQLMTRGARPSTGPLRVSAAGGLADECSGLNAPKAREREGGHPGAARGSPYGVDKLGRAFQAIRPPHGGDHETGSTSPRDHLQPRVADADRGRGVVSFSSPGKVETRFLPVRGDKPSGAPGNSLVLGGALAAGVRDWFGPPATFVRGQCGVDGGGAGARDDYT